MEDAVVLIDETFMDSGKKGYLFSTQCLYADGSQMKYKNPPKTSGIPMPLRYEELDDVGKAMLDSTQNDSFSLRFKSGESITVVCKYAQLVSEILWAVLQVRKQEEAAGASSVSPEEKQPEEVRTAPEKHSVQEMLDLGAACSRQKDFEGAVRWYEAALESGELQEEAVPALQNMCGMLCCVEDNPNPQIEKALFWFEKAARGGHVRAQYQCGVMYFNGQGTKQDLKKALEYLELAAAQGLEEAKAAVPQLKAMLASAPKAEPPKPAAQEELPPDEAYARGMELYRAKQYERAIPYLELACADKAGDSYQDARIAWGWILENVYDNKTDAFQQYYIAGKKGCVPGREASVRLLASGLKTSKHLFMMRQHLASALEWARELAAYKNKDYAEALRWYLKAAEQGDAKAQYNCGNMYDNGEGAEEDKVEALRWYLKAAEQGHADAQFYCGCMYDKGEGTKEDKARGCTGTKNSPSRAMLSFNSNAALCTIREKVLRWTKLNLKCGSRELPSRGIRMQPKFCGNTFEPEGLSAHQSDRKPLLMQDLWILSGRFFPHFSDFFRKLFYLFNKVSYFNLICKAFISRRNCLI